MVIEADENLFKDPSWPKQIRSEKNMAKYYAAVSKILQAHPYDDSASSKLKKRETFKNFAEQHKVPLKSPDLAVNFHISGQNKWRLSATMYIMWQLYIRMQFFS